MKQTKKVVVRTTKEDLVELIEQVQKDISNLKLSLADKMSLLEKLQKLLEDEEK